jgi:mono/diheme cytochrome c family protein
MKKTGWLGAGAIVGILVLLACSCATREADRAGWREKEEQTARIASGGRLFAAYCTSCHGADARGHGPAAAAL